MGIFRDRIPLHKARTAAFARRGGNTAEPTTRLSHLFPQLGARSTSSDLLVLADALVISAARDEFVREGFSYVSLPSSWTRQDLNKAELTKSTEFRSFAQVTLQSLDFDSPRVPSEKEMERILGDSASADEYGPTLEAASAAVVFLVARALVLDPSLTPANQEVRDALDTRLAQLRERAATQLTKMVTVPQELRHAMSRRDAIHADGNARHSHKSGFDTSSSTSHESNSAGQEHFDQAGQGEFPWAFPAGKVSMHDVFSHAAKVQAFLKTKEGQHVASFAAAALASASQYASKRKGGTKPPSA